MAFPADLARDGESPAFVGPLRRLALFVAVAFVTRLVLIGVRFIDLDEASYLVGAWELLRGGHLYVDFADHKPPLVYAYYALAQLLGHGMLSVRLLTHLVTVPLTAYAVSAFYRHGDRGLVAGLAFLVYGTAFLGHDVLSVNCELLMLLPLAGSLVLVRDAGAAGEPARALGAGLLVGLAVLFKYQAAAWLPPIAFVAGWAASRARVARSLVVLVAGAVPALLAWGYFWSRGSGADFVYWNLGRNLTYMANAPSLSEASERAAAYFASFLLATSPLWWMAIRVGGEVFVPAEPAADRRYRAVLLGSIFVCALGAAFAGWRFYPHYFVPLYVPLALAAAPDLHRRMRPPLGRSGRALLALTGVLWVGFTAANAYLYYARDDVYVETRPAVEEVARRLERDPCFGRGTLFVWGYAPQLYARSGLPPATRFVFIDTTLVGHVSARRPQDGAANLVIDRHWDWLMGDLARKPPVYVLDASRARLSRWGTPLENYPRLAAFVAAGYQPLAEVGGVRIYRKRACE